MWGYNDKIPIKIPKIIQIPIFVVDIMHLPDNPDDVKKKPGNTT